VWIFSTTAGHRIKLIFTEFELEPHQVCKFVENFISGTFIHCLIYCIVTCTSVVVENTVHVMAKSKS
jgi:hypothetical protein